MDELSDIIGFQTANLESVVIDLWRRIPHPETLVPGGPEIDAVLQSDKVVIFCEIEWMAKISGKQGKAGDKDQVGLRVEYFARYGRKIFRSQRESILLGISPEGGMLGNNDTPDYSMRDATWKMICGIAGHSYHRELLNYLDWKRKSRLVRGRMCV